MGEPEVREGADVFLHLEYSIRVFRIQARRWIMMVTSLEIQVHPDVPQAEMQEMFRSTRPGLYRAEQRAFQGKLSGQDRLGSRKTLQQAGPSLVFHGASPLKTPCLNSGSGQKTSVAGLLSPQGQMELRRYILYFTPQQRSDSENSQCSHLPQLCSVTRSHPHSLHRMLCLLYPICFHSPI